MRGSHNALLIKPIPHTDKCPWPDARAIKNLEIVRELARTATYGADAFRNCPRFLRQALETKAWQHYADDFGKVFDYADSDFDKFARAKWPKGLDVPEGAEGLKRICAAYKGEEDAEIALRIIRELTPEAKTHAEAGAMGGRGKKATHNMRGFHHESPTGVLVRLKRDRPDLARKVEVGELSANAAAVMAGFRPVMIQHPATVNGFAKSIRAHLSAAEQAELMAALRAR